MPDQSTFDRITVLLLALLPGGLWCAWWLWAVNWNKLGPILREGAWAPVVLLVLIAAGVWSRILPSECTCLGVVAIPNFWWQLSCVIALALIAMFCGWLQLLFDWTPTEIELEPAAHGHGHDHGHHGHEHH